MSVGIKQAERAQAALSRSHSSHRSRGFTLLHLMIAIAAVGMMLSASVSIFGAEAPVRQASPSPGHKRIMQRPAEPRGTDAPAASVRQPDTAGADAREVGEARPQDAPMVLRASAAAEQTTR